MKISDLIRILKKHIVLLLVTPLLLAGLVILLTRHPNFKYASETTLYTGIASGSSVEMDKSFNYLASNTTFDNLISVIKSRETLREVAIRLLAQHLMLDKYEARYISDKSFGNLRQITPDYVKSLVVNSNDQRYLSDQKTQPVVQSNVAKTDAEQNVEYGKHVVRKNETLYSISVQYGLPVDQIKELNEITENKIIEGQTLLVGKQMILNSDANSKDTPVAIDRFDNNATFSFSNLDTSSINVNMFPASINLLAYEQTVKNLTALGNSSDTNFVFKLLNFIHPYYSIDAISSVNVQRIANSDLVKLKYETDDPGICQQTLKILTAVCIKNYKSIKENRSDAVVKYFNFQLLQAASRLKTAEAKMLKFNEDNNIINFNEQSKAASVVKENLDADYNNKKIKLAGTQAAIKRLEEKLGVQQLMQLKSSKILDRRNQLGELNYKIVSAETTGFANDTEGSKLADLKLQAEKLKDEIRISVGELYTSVNSTEGLPVSTIMNTWITNVIEAENLKAGLGVLDERIKEFQKQYAIYAPAGANIKQIEREISVSEQEYLELLRGLNLAKLKLQDNELSSNIKTIDPAYFPLSPMPTKRKILIVIAAMLGFIIVLTSILALEFFDNTLKNPVKSSEKLGLPFLSVLPKIILKTQNVNFPFIINRLLEIAVQNIKLYLKTSNSEKRTKTLLFFSTQAKEGKSVVAGNLAQRFKTLGEKVLVLNFSYKSIQRSDIIQIGYPDMPLPGSSPVGINEQRRISMLSRLLGYPDTRVDINNHFLKDPENYLSKEEILYYNVDDRFQSVNNYQEILELNNFSLAYTPDIVLIEIPPILYYPYPAGLISEIDLPILVCRSNRDWSEADKGALDVFSKLTGHQTHFILNRVELQVIESVLGKLT